MRMRTKAKLQFYYLIKNISKILVIFVFFYSGLLGQKSQTIWLDDLNVILFSEGIPSISPKTNADGDSILRARKYYNKGIGVLCISVLSFYLDGNAAEFSFDVNEAKNWPLLEVGDIQWTPI